MLGSDQEIGLEDLKIRVSDEVQEYHHDCKSNGARVEATLLESFLKVEIQ